MSNYVIGIGGTGAKCVEAFVNLLGAGLLDNEVDTNILLIDVDISCGNVTRVERTINEYNLVKKSIGGTTKKVFKNNIERVLKWSPMAALSEMYDGINTSSKFRDVLQLSNLAGNIPMDVLAKSMFSDEERNTSLSVGFRGHPNIGVAVTSLCIDEAIELIENNDVETECRYFIFGSAYGGTGAAGFPTIAKNLKARFPNEGCHHKIGGALLLPYFNFDGTANGMYAKPAEFLLNTQAALQYYADTGELGSYDKVYLLGSDRFTNMGECNIGGPSQQNDAHFVELLGALAAIHFFNSDGDTKVNPYLCAREAENLIAWTDMPVAHTDIMQKIKQFIRFVHVFDGYIYPVLDEQRRWPNEKNRWFWQKQRSAWERKLIQTVGGIDIGGRDSNKNAEWERMSNIKKFIFNLFIWLYQIESTYPEDFSVKLVNKDVLPVRCEKKVVNGQETIVYSYQWQVQNKEEYNYSNIIIEPTGTYKLLKEANVESGLVNIETESGLTNVGLACLIDSIYDIC